MFSKLFKSASLILILGILLFIAGCSEQKANDSRDQLRKGAAAATEEIKKDSTAIAQGVKEGWNRDKKGLVNINSASKAELLNLPGVTQRNADAIIKARPYEDKHELVTKGLLSENEYGRIADSITVN
ncbi:MAG TPA: helix-hairpin-helix domain-containing protein [Terriglobales bacterium]|nr:helix-hairpin-helix domain-containing protein [Terriglobales bacterium]